MRKMFVSPMVTPYWSPYGSSGKLRRSVENGGLRAKPAERAPAAPVEFTPEQVAYAANRGLRPGEGVGRLRRAA